MARDHFTSQFWISFSIIVASVICAAIMAYFLMSDLTVQANKIVIDRAEVTGNTDSLQELAQLERDAPHAAQYQAAMNQLLPNQYSLVTFDQWLAQLGEKYNITTDSVFQGVIIQPQGTTPGTAQFSFDAEGSESNIVLFLDAMNSKSLGFLMTLSAFDATSDGQNEKVVGQGTLFFQ